MSTLIADLENARKSLMAPVNPVTQQTFTRELVIDAGGGRTRVVKRRVAPFIDMAEQLGCDYYHEGGTLVESSGKVRGTRPEGWFVNGYKWANDRPENAASEEDD